ncbi:IS3 family transposase [Flammeovirga pectinis]|uniref:IS3 family transposase n=1 Tax=Flammeovirga pectinis TaxID=2494373 RepID=A0A3S9P053_9BACT|nr:IS3 family transposase [Flammeovirga pectinis]AZQ61564.1 IS3 family transposase [Flammeovirga pectinis]
MTDLEYENARLRKALKEAEEEREILKKAVYKESKGRFGSPKVTKILNNNGFHVSRPKIARMMKKEDLISIISRKFKVQTTLSDHDFRISPNLLDRNFNPHLPSKAWVSDITYLWTSKGWTYLTIIMDLFDRQIKGWSISDTMTMDETVNRAWEMSILNRKPSHGLIFHSDRSVQYSSKSFLRILSNHNVVKSMSRKDLRLREENAVLGTKHTVAEHFFKILKYEYTNHVLFHVKLKVAEYIEIWYNRKRPHSKLRYVSPYFYYNYKKFKVA